MRSYRGPIIERGVEWGVLERDANTLVSLPHALAAREFTGELVIICLSVDETEWFVSGWNEGGSQTQALWTVTL